MPLVGIGTPPNPPPAGWCAPSPLFLGGGEHSLARKGLGESQCRRGAYTVVLFLCTYFVFATSNQHTKQINTNAISLFHLTATSNLHPHREIGDIFGCFIQIFVMGAMLTSPCLSCPTTVIPDGPRSPCPSAPNGSTRPPTSGPNFHVVLIQVTPVVHFDPKHVTPL
jgi:hypothetical protein